MRKENVLRFNKKIDTEYRNFLSRLPVFLPKLKSEPFDQSFEIMVSKYRAAIARGVSEKVVNTIFANLDFRYDEPLTKKVVLRRLALPMKGKDSAWIANEVMSEEECVALVMKLKEFEPELFEG